MSILTKLAFSHFPVIAVFVFFRTTGSKTRLWRTRSHAPIARVSADRACGHAGACPSDHHPHISHVRHTDQQAFKWWLCSSGADGWQSLDVPILRRIQDTQGAYHFWQQGGGYDRNLFSEDEYGEKLTYMHDNAVRRGLVSRAADWRWSSAEWYDGEKDRAAMATDRFKP